MNRREALTALAAMFAAAACGSRRLFAAGSPASSAIQSGELPHAIVEMLTEFGETILPQTPASGGARDARVGEFLAELFRDFSGEDEREEILDNIEKINRASEARFGQVFMDLNTGERHELLMSLEGDRDADYYRLLKNAVNWGYFTSQVGATEALQHIPIPGRFEGCITVGPEYRAWSS